MRTSLGPLLTCLLTLSLSPWGASAQPPGFINFESGLVRPLALSADAMTLYAVNAPDGRLEIFDVSGRRVRKLLSGESPEGPRSLFWDGRDESGRELASGVYFYRLKAGGQSRTRKLVLLR